jgi:Protein of unknown function (DUF1580)
MIDHGKETLLTLTDAAAGLPRRRGGKRVNVATVYRWAARGCRGVRLETIQIGGTKCTSLEALQRFFERLSDPDQNSSLKGGPVPRPQSDARRQRDSEAIERQLEQLGL